MFSLLLLSASCAQRAGDREELLARAVKAGAPAGARWVGPWANAGAPVQHTAAPLEIEEIQARIEKLALHDRTAQTTEALGIATSLAGAPDKGISTLAESVLLSPTAATVNNLGVAYLMAAALNPAAAAPGRVRALDAFLQATQLQPTLPEPRFNLAITLEQLGLSVLAEREFGAALLSESNSYWRSEISAKRKVLNTGTATWAAVHRSVHDGTASPEMLRQMAGRFPEAVEECVEQDLLPEWAESASAARAADAERVLVRISAVTAHLKDRHFLPDTVAAIRRASRAERRQLAAIHTAFARARTFYEGGHYEAAETLLRRERGSARALTPFALRLELELATVLYQFRHVADARAICERVYADGTERLYGGIAARAQWLRGITLLQGSSFEAALAAYDSAIGQYEALGELENAAAVANAAADTLRILGEHRRGWSYLVDRTFHAFPITRNVRRRYVALLNASLYASDERLMAAALYFQNASVEAARERGVPNFIVESLSRRATLLLKSGNATAAEADLLEAKRRLAEIPSLASQRYQGAWLDAVAAQSQATRAPETALTTLDRTIEAFEKAEPAEVPRLYVARGDAAEALKRHPEAEASYHKAVNAFEQRWDRLSADEHRVFYLDEGWPAYQRLIDAMARDQRKDAAFGIAERARARSLAMLRGGGSAPATMQAIQASVPPSTAVVYYAVLDSRLLTWVITAGASRLIQAPIAETRLATLVTTFTGLLEADSDPVGQRRLSTELFELLIAPVAAETASCHRLIVIPDGPLHVLPFSALVNRRTGKYLMETYELAMSPSAKELMLASRRVTRPNAAPYAALAAGAVPPTPDLPSLPNAARELKAVADAYGQSTLVTGADATPDRLRELAGRFEIIHLATHARSSSTSPRLSFVQLARGSAASGRLYAGDIAAWPLPRAQLVVLSACDTTAGAVYRGEGLVSLARPFLAAGVPAVVATLWPIDDRATLELMVAFHRLYAREHDAARALAQAQRGLMATPQFAHPRYWASFVAFAGIVDNAPPDAATGPRRSQGDTLGRALPPRS